MSIDLRERRVIAKRTQEDVAKVLGINQSQVSRYEEDPGDVPQRLLIPWLKFLGASLEAGPEVEESSGLNPGTPYRTLHERLALLDSYTRTGQQGPVAKAAKRVDGPTLEDLRGLVSLLGRKPNLVLTGRFDSGKSRIANSLLGSDLLPSQFQPMTRLPTYVRHVSDKPAWMNARERVLIFKNGFDPLRWGDEKYCRNLQLASGGLDLVKAYGTHKGEYRNDEEAGIALVFAEAPLLEACNVLDLPGFNNTDGGKSDTRKAKAVFPYIDILMYVAPAIGFMDSSDFSYLSMLLRALPPIEKEVKGIPFLGNLLVVASHAHPGVTDDQLKKEILDGGAERLLTQFGKTVLTERKGGKVDPAAVRARFFSFWAETPARRRSLEDAVLDAIVRFLPAVAAQRADREIQEFKKRARGNVERQITTYEHVLGDIRRARTELQTLEDFEPRRRADFESGRSDIKRKIAEYGQEHLRALETAYQKEINIQALEVLIEQEFGRKANPKEEAKRYAGALVLERIQHQAGQIATELSQDLAQDIEQYLGRYENSARQTKVSTDRMLEIPFDAKGAFFGGMAGVGFVGAMTAWAAGLGNLGAYIIAAKAVGVLASLGISIPGGTAAVMAALASIGGPITIGVGVAVAIGLAIWRLFGDTWQVRLAKRIHEEFEARDLLGLLRTQAAEYWEASARAFERGAEKTEQDFLDRLEAMRRMLAEPGKSGSEIEAKLESLKVLRDFFGGIPWYGV